ncbi:MAG: undecaprenyl-diphosphate phosphatase [Planctomycetota bacterium]|nr:undecaprenyl-diphosphate phosphatase [Planctomycetota bacterium]
MIVLTPAASAMAAAALAAGAQATEAPAAVDPPSAAAVLALAVLQGLTEFLPVSSSGHLALGRALLGVREGGLALDVALHVGTLAAVVAAFRRDVGRLLKDLFRGHLALWVWLGAATVPVALVGMLLKSHVEAASTSVTAAGVGLLLTSVLLLAGERARKGHEASREVTDPSPVARPRPWDAVAMGCAQAVAVWPGVSRSGSTISAGLLMGVRAEEAARLSFLMSIPAISGAAVLELPAAVDEGFGGISSGLVLGAAAVAAVVGFAALRTLLLVLRKGSFRYFAAYCATLGVAALALA